MAAAHYRYLRETLKPLRMRLMSHGIYRSLHSAEELHTFFRHHVFAVWDFMSLLKALQRNLTCLDEVWVPHGDRSARRLINEIVVAEESDRIDDGYTSHFELYLEAMRQSGCSTDEIEAVLARLASGTDVMSALNAAPPAARQFCRTTFTTIRSGSLPAIAAAFTLGREDVIPDMFTEMVADLAKQGDVETSIFTQYLRRHIELDSEEHGPMAERLLRSVCGDDEAKWRSAGWAAEQSLRARIQLWDDALKARAGSNLATDHAI